MSSTELGGLCFTSLSRRSLSDSQTKTMNPLMTGIGHLAAQCFCWLGSHVSVHSVVTTLIYLHETLEIGFEDRVVDFL